MKFKISLSEKVLLGIGSLVALALIEALYVSHTMVLGSFAKLEEQEVRTDVERAQRSIKGELENLTSICGDWAPRDDSRNFMLGQAPDYNTSILTVSALVNLNLNFAIYIDTSDRIFHITAIDIEKGVFVQAPPPLIDRILADKSLLDIEDPTESKSGLIILQRETVLLAAQPISNSLSQKPISGTLIMGRYLNDSVIKKLNEQTRLDISIAYNDDSAKPPDFVQADAKLSKDNNIIVQILGENNIAGYTNIYDTDGNKYITLKVAVPREIYSRGHRTVHYFMMVMVLTVVVMLATLLLVMQKIVLRPIDRLTKNFINIGGNYGGNTKLYTERGDEIGSLARSFDLVIKNLRRKMSDLNESEKRFEEAAENSGDWIWEVNAEGLYTYASPVVEELLGYKPDEIVGKKCFYDFFVPDQREELKKASFEAFARREGFKGFINPNIHKNGKIVILETNARPIADDEGNLCGYRGVDRDITERKQAQEKIEQTLSLLTATLESTADGILVVDINGMVIGSNKKFQQLWRISDELIESKNDDKLLAYVLDQLEDPEGFLTEVRRLYASTEEESFDLLKFKDGRVFERFSQPQKVGDRIVGRVWSFRDITERKQAEERLLAINSLQKLLLPPAPIEQKLKFVTDAVVRILDADFARVWVIRPGDRCDAGCTHAEVTDGPHVCRFRDKCLHLMASSGRYTHLDGKVHRRVPFGCYKIGLVAAAEHDKFLTNEAAIDPRVHNHDWVKELGLVSFAGYRLMHTDGMPLGVLALFSKHPISPEDDAILEGIANSTSMVIHTSRIEEETKKSRKVLQDMIDAMPFGVIVVGKDKKIRQANIIAQQLSGYSEKELLGQLCHKTLCLAQENACPIFDLNQKLDRSERKLLTKDGRQVPIFKSTVELKLGDEDVLLEAFIDITDRKEMEDALRKNEEFTRRVIESSSDCIKVLDLEGRLLSMSGGGQKLLEIDDITPYLNASFIDYWKGKEREACLEAIAKAKQGDTGVFYGYFKTVKGKPKWWEVIVTPIKDVDGSINSLLAVSRDITERKKAEETVENLNRDLKSIVARLTQSNKRLREFAYLAAHDLKTPLRGISTLAQWLVNDYKEKFDDDGRRQVDLLVERVERMNELINAILQYSTIARKRDKECPIDLNSLVGTILVEMRPPPSIKITVNKKLPTVVCKEAHLRQVFYHLLSNAVKFMDKPEGRIAIDYTDKKDLWEFSVSDNGPGIEQRHFERIFQFFQTLGDLDSSKGSGIGLTLIRRIIELYDGQIWITSELGLGSTFFFTLPKSLSPVSNEKPLLAASS